MASGAAASCSWLACLVVFFAVSESCSVRLAFSGPGDCSGVDDAFGVPRALALLLPTRCGRSALECFRAGVSGAAAGLAGVLVPLWDRLRSRLVELVLLVPDDFGSGGFSDGVVVFGGKVRKDSVRLVGLTAGDILSLWQHLGSTRLKFHQILRTQSCHETLRIALKLLKSGDGVSK